MGNSPSRDDSSTIAGQSMSLPGATPGELESDEGALSKGALSRHKDEVCDERYNDFSRSSPEDLKLNKDNPTLKYKSKTPSQTRIKPMSVPPKPKGYSSGSDINFDVEIGASAAMVLNSHSYESYSSAETSDYSALSPVFTTNGESRDEDLELSIASANSPPSGGNLTSFRDDLKGDLDPIVERSLESTPEPLKASPNASNKSFGVTRKRSRGSFADEMSKLAQVSSNSSCESPSSISRYDKVEIDVDLIIERLLVSGNKTYYKSASFKKAKDKLPVTPEEIKYVLQKARSIFLTQPGLLRLSPPVKIVGDIHGQFEDLLRIFKACGPPPHSNYLFMGDYVDRGHKSLETIMLLLCYKIKYPENFFMLRGNHESANITKIYGFYDECKRRLPNRKIWKDFIDVFNTLPIAATINEKIFCIHGGLSPDLHDLNQIESIKRPTDVPDKGLLADLLWSDPDPSVKNSNWTKNDRGVSYCFGKRHVDHFCSKFNMDLIVRGHMVVEDGYEFFNKRKLVTVFLAPNYCGDFNNFGSVMKVDKKLCCSFELIKPSSRRH